MPAVTFAQRPACCLAIRECLGAMPGLLTGYIREGGEGEWLKSTRFAIARYSYCGVTTGR